MHKLKDIEKSLAKVQKFYETESHKTKKVAKRDENSSFEGQKSIKTTNFTINNVQKGTVGMILPYSTQAVPFRRLTAILQAASTLLTGIL